MMTYFRMPLLSHEIGPLAPGNVAAAARGGVALRDSGAAPLAVKMQPPRVIDDTNPADVDHTGDGTTPTDGQLVPDYRQLGFRVPTILVSGLARR